MKPFIIVHDSPYGRELSYNALHLAMALQKTKETEISLFLLGDSVVSAKTNQATPTGYYSLERMLKLILKKKGEVYLCGSCLDARGVSDNEIIMGCTRSTMDVCATLTLEADKVLVF